MKAARLLPLRRLLAGGLAFSLALLTGCWDSDPVWTDSGAGFDVPSPSPSQSVPVTISPSPTNPVESEEVTTPPVETGGLRYARQYLTAEQQEAYDRMVEAAAALESSFTWTGLTDQELGQVLRYMVVDYPEFFWLSSGYQTSTTQSGGVPTVTLTFRYTTQPQDVPQARAQVEQVAQSCLSGVEDGWNDYEKIKWVYDFVVRHTQYDGAYSDQSLYSVMVYGRGVCAGYSRSVQYLLNSLGIPCTYVSGTARGGSHGWNLVMADGEYYYLDATWGDPIFTDSSQQDPDLVGYDYFCVTTEELTRTHTIGDDMPVPECTARACNYYVYNGLELERYSEEAVEAIITQAALAGEDAVMRFTTGAALGDATTILIQRDGIFDILARVARQVPSLNANSIQYATDDDTYRLTLYLQYTS